MKQGIERQKEVIRDLCSLQALVWNCLDPNATTSSDCFCEKQSMKGESYRHENLSLEYIRNAVVEKLKADGYTFPEGYEPVLGREIMTDEL